MSRICVTGGSGFVGSHLVNYLKSVGHWVRAVDIKEPEWGWPGESPDEFCLLDLRKFDNCLLATQGMQQVYALAADMGGIGYIHAAHAAIAFNNSLISNHTLEAARLMGVQRYLFSSSACVYGLHLQTSAEVTPLKESDAYPAMPEDAYGWEKLVTERTCRHYYEDYGLETRVARFHNIMGPFGTYDGGKEKAPAALCRKTATAKLTGTHEIEIWGDGEQTRSFCFIDDCVFLLHRLMESGHREPVNIGTDRLVSINELADLIARAAGIEVVKRHVPGTQGVRGRNADLTIMEQVLGSPRWSLEAAIKKTYAWVQEQVEHDRCCM
jgi:GDP-D-mannose 3', 5'-epimerase